MGATAWTIKLKSLHEPGGGALMLDVIMHADRAELDRRAAEGDQRCRRLLRTLMEMHEAVAARARRAPIACSVCPAPVHTTRWAAVIVAPEQSDDPAAALSLVICAACGPTPSDVRHAAMPVLRQAFPGAFVVLPKASGRA